jgi:hypothetical protein
MTNSNYQKTKTNTHPNTAHVNAAMHSTSSNGNENIHYVKDGHTLYYTIFYTIVPKINGNTESVMG